MPIQSVLINVTHLLTYSFLFGTQIWHSFIGGIISFRALPRAHFAALQQRLFPIYFALQSFLSFILILTYPDSLPLNHAQPLIYSSLLAILVPAVFNTVIAGPQTSVVITKRKGQEQFDGRTYDGRKIESLAEGAERGGDKENDEIRVSDEMKKLNKVFGMWHGISSLLNMASVIGTVVYGVLLAGAIN